MSESTTDKGRAPVRPEDFDSLAAKFGLGPKLTAKMKECAGKVARAGIKAKGKVVLTLNIECTEKDDQKLFGGTMVSIKPAIAIATPAEAHGNKSVFVAGVGGDTIISFDDPEMGGVSL